MTHVYRVVFLVWLLLVAQLAWMANAVIDTAMAGWLSAIDLPSVGIAAAIMATVLMSLISAGEQSGQTTVLKQNASQFFFGILWPQVQ